MNLSAEDPQPAAAVRGRHAGRQRAGDRRHRGHRRIDRAHLQCLLWRAQRLPRGRRKSLALFGDAIRAVAKPMCAPANGVGVVVAVRSLTASARHPWRPSRCARGRHNAADRARCGLRPAAGQAAGHRRRLHRLSLRARRLSATAQKVTVPRGLADAPCVEVVQRSCVCVVELAQPAKRHCASRRRVSIEAVIRPA